MESIIKQNDVDYFLRRIEKTFPNFIAGIITDRHGFPIASKIPKNFHLKEADLALSAIADERNFISDDKFTKVVRDLNETNSIKLFLLLQKSNKYLNRFKTLKSIIRKHNIF